MTREDWIPTVLVAVLLPMLIGVGLYCGKHRVCAETATRNVDVPMKCTTLCLLKPICSTECKPATQRIEEYCARYEWG